MTDAIRRALLQTGLGATLLATAPLALTATQSAGLAIEPLGDKLFLVTGAGINVVAASDGAGLLLVDGGLARNGDKLLALLQKQTGIKRVPILFNTSWHRECTGLNERLGKSGARIIAHENTRLWLTTDVELPWADEAFLPLPVKARPNDTFYTTASLDFGAERVEYGYLPLAHTDGDLYVFFRKANVLVTGGVVTADRWPVVDYVTGGWIGGMNEGLRKLLALTDANTRVVPGTGAVMTRADLEARQKMVATIAERLSKLLRTGHGPREALDAQPTKEWDEKYGDPRQFVTQAFRSQWGHMAPDA